MREGRNGERPKGLIAAIVVYAWVAIGAVPVVLLLAATGQLSVSPLHAIVDKYSGPSAVFFHLGAAVCAWLLFKRSRHAIWPAASVAAWTASMIVGGWFSRAAPPRGVFEITQLAWGTTFIVLVACIARWRKQGRVA